jgi:hypothetical protein
MPTLAVAPPVTTKCAKCQPRRRCPSSSPWTSPSVVACGQQASGSGRGTGVAGHVGSARSPALVCSSADCRALAESVCCREIRGVERGLRASSERSKRSGVSGTARTFHERSSAPSRQDVCRMGSAHRRAHAGSGRCHDRLGLRAKSIARLARGKHHDDTRQAVGVRVRRGRAARSAEVQEAAHTLALRVLNCHWERT